MKNNDKLKPTARKKFVLYSDYRDKLKGFPPEVVGEVFLAILDYQNGDNPKFTNPASEMAFNFIKADLDNFNTRYEAQVKRNRQNGQSGGRPSASNNPHETNQPQNNPVGFSGNPQQPMPNPQKADNGNGNGNVNSNEFNNLAAADATADVSNSSPADPSLNLSPSQSPPPLKSKQFSSTSGIIAQRLGVVLKPPKNGGASYEWQDFAVRYTKELKINIDSVKPSWFKMFRDAEKNGKRGELEAAFSLLFDSRAWEKYDNSRKIKCIFYIYQHGLEAFKQKGNQ